MVKIILSLILQGDDFSPNKIKSTCGESMRDFNEPHEIGTIGRYRGIPIPYGSAIIQLSENPQEWDALDEMLSFLKERISIYKAAGTEEMTLSLSIFHDGQCNFGFTRDELKLIHDLNVDIMISCYSEG